MVEIIGGWVPCSGISRPRLKPDGYEKAMRPEVETSGRTGKC